MSGRAPRRRPRGRSLLVAACLPLVVSGCGGTSGGGGDACPSPRAAPQSETRLLPDGLTFRGIGPVTHVAVTEGYVTVRAVSGRELDQLTVKIQDAVIAAGYRPAGMDNEGFEAEVFFTAGAYAAGQALVRQGACDGRWDIDLVLVDPELVPEASGTVTPSTAAT